jgi:quinol-cytochrome oxidoreductase complex cytochrome b subunit
MICNLYINLMSIDALWSMSSCILCLHMFAQHVVLVGFVVIVVISLTLWMLGIDVVIRESV